MDLYKCHELRQERKTFPFALDLFCLFLERFPETRPTFEHFPPSFITKAQMRMWGKMMPKRGLLNYSARISVEALILLANEDDHAFVVLEFLYVGIDWRQCPNILFIVDELLDYRGKISVLFKII